MSTISTASSRLGHAIDSIGAKRVAWDTLETIFSAFSNHFILRAELRRLFRWLKDKGVTAIITGGRGDGSLTRHGLEEYVSDCVIMLDPGSTTRSPTGEYRDSHQGTNEYPFLIDENGFSVLPISSAGLRHHVSNDRNRAAFRGSIPCSAAGVTIAGAAFLIYEPLAQARAASPRSLSMRPAGAYMLSMATRVTKMRSRSARGFRGEDASRGRHHGLSRRAIL